MEQKEKTAQSLPLTGMRFGAKAKRQKAAQSLPLTINSEESVLVQKRKEIAQSLPLTVNLEQKTKSCSEFTFDGKL